MGAAAGRDLSLSRLAHELNSLLDGSIRFLALAERSLAAAAQPVEATAETSRFIGGACEGLRSMAELLERAMRASPSGGVLDIWRSGERLGAVVPRIVRALAPMASDEGVELSWRADAAAARVPAGLLEPVLRNGLRNAIAAAAAPAHPRRPRVSLEASVDGDCLSVAIHDSGPGPGGLRTPGGHGLGLGLSRQIVEHLAGTLELVGESGGTALRLRVPVAVMEREQGEAGR